MRERSELSIKNGITEKSFRVRYTHTITLDSLPQRFTYAALNDGLGGRINDSMRYGK